MSWLITGIVIGILLGFFVLSSSGKIKAKELDLKNKTIKKTHKIFLLYDYEEEERYLREMHRSGWKLLYTVPYTYVFEKSEPEDVVYRIDFQSDHSMDKADYIQMFKDYGWEYMQDFNSFSYFRRPAEGLTEQETEIFCDDTSRLELMNRVAKFRLIPIATLFLALILPKFIRLVRDFFSRTDHMFKDVAAIIVLILLVAAEAAMILKTVIKYLKLKRKYDDNK